MANPYGFTDEQWARMSPEDKAHWTRQATVNQQRQEKYRNNLQTMRGTGAEEAAQILGGITSGQITPQKAANLIPSEQIKRGARVVRTVDGRIIPAPSGNVLVRAPSPSLSQDDIRLAQQEGIQESRTLMAPQREAALAGMNKAMQEYMNSKAWASNTLARQAELKGPISQESGRTAIQNSENYNTQRQNMSNTRQEMVWNPMQRRFMPAERPGQGMQQGRSYIARYDVGSVNPPVDYNARIAEMQKAAALRGDNTSAGIAGRALLKREDEIKAQEQQSQAISAATAAKQAEIEAPIKAAELKAKQDMEKSIRDMEREILTDQAKKNYSSFLANKEKKDAFVSDRLNPAVQIMRRNYGPQLVKAGNENQRKYAEALAVSLMANPDVSVEDVVKSFGDKWLVNSLFGLGDLPKLP